MDGEKATDGGLERGSHPLFAAVIAVGEGDIMAITGISYGRTFVYETQKRVNEGVLQSTSDAENRFAENLEAAEENDKALAPVGDDDAEMIFTGKSTILIPKAVCV